MQEHITIQPLTRQGNNNGKHELEFTTHKLIAKNHQSQMKLLQMSLSNYIMSLKMKTLKISQKHGLTSQAVIPDIQMK